MIGAADLSRYIETTQEIAGGDVRAQLDAWGVDHDEFMEWMTAYSNAFGQRMRTDPSVVLVAVFSGFEMGYRACAEAGIASESAPDFPPEVRNCSTDCWAQGKCDGSCGYRGDN